jgi:hypothetical protein
LKRYGEKGDAPSEKGKGEGEGPGAEEGRGGGQGGKRGESSVRMRLWVSQRIGALLTEVE